MKDFIITADWHCHAWQEGGESVGGTNQRLQDFMYAFDEMIGYATKHGIEQIYQLGDVYHLKKNIPVDAYNMLWERARAASKYINWTFLAGNHDRDDDRPSVVTILPYRAFGNVLTAPDIFDDIVFLPWLYDQTRVRQFLRDLGKKSYKLLLFHGELDGAAVGPTDYQLKSKMTEQLIQPERFQQIFAGHLHKQQRHKGVWYPGSLIPKDFGELETNKGFLHVSKDSVTSVHVQAPLFQVFTLPATLTDRQIRLLCKAIPGNLVRFESPGRIDPGVMRLFEQANPRYIKVKLTSTQRDLPVRPEREDEGFETLIRQHVEQKGVPPELAPGYVDYGLDVLRRI